jgi:hypothetical protein
VLQPHVTATTGLSQYVLSLLSSETAVEKVNDWGASLERQLKDVGDVLELH